VFEIGDIVILKEEHYLSRVVYGQWVIDDFRRKPFRPLSSTMIEYHIKTLSTNSEGSPSMTWVKTDDIISLSKIRDKKLNELGI
jgi:hypothetical protein